MIPELYKRFLCSGCGVERGRFLCRVGTEKDFSVVLCVSCGLAHIHPRPEEENDNFQSRDSGDYEAVTGPLRSGFSYHHNRLLGILGQHVPPPGRLLEVGGSGGSFLEAAHRVGYEGWGVDPASRVPTAPAKGIRILKERVERVDLPQDYFDVAVAIQVIEHLHSPRLLIEKMVGALKPGGYLYVETPNFGALARRFRSPRFMNLNVAPGHWHLFNARNLKSMVSPCGVFPIRSWTFFKALSAYGDGGLRPAMVLGLNSVLGSMGLANTLAFLGRKGGEG
jgi:SAM-dependent methyltransferase